MQWESLSGHHLFPRMNWLMVPQCSAVLWLASVSTFICTLCASSLFSLPSAFTVFLRVVDPRQDFFSLPGLLCTHQAVPSRLRGRGWVGGICWVPLLVCRPSCTHAHNPVQTLGPDLSALPRLWAQTHTWQILLLSLSLATLPLCSHCHPSTAHELQSMLGELMVQEEGVGGWLGRGEGERGKGWGSLRRLG